MRTNSTKIKPVKFRRNLVSQACITVSMILATGAANAGAGWADNINKAGIAFKQATFYANSPQGWQPALDANNMPQINPDTGAPYTPAEAFAASTHINSPSRIFPNFISVSFMG